MSGFRPPVGLYLHVPFCLSLCPYCDFVVNTGRAARGPAAQVARFVRAVGRELELRAAALGTPRAPLRSVYFGGGTPSLLSVGAVGGLLERAARGYGLAADAEVTLEVNPGPDDRGDLAGFRAAGVNRLSIGVQSLDAHELRALGRRHTPGDVRDTVRLARAAGYDDLSLDLLYDLPHQSERSWRRTLHAACALDPDHVSAYALSLDDPDADGSTGPGGDHLPVRPGARRWRERARAAQDADRAADLYVLADDILGAAGLRWYELSNWARPGRHGRHNLAYWRREPYEGLGPGAHAFDGHRVRRWNAASLAGYLEALDPPDGAAPRPPPGGREVLDDRAVRAEETMLPLRLRAGLDTTSATARSAATALRWGTQHDLLEPAMADRVRLTMRGRLLSNELFQRLL